MNLHVWILFSLLIFCIGMYGVLVRKNLIALLIGVELMLNAASISFLAFGHLGSPSGLLPKGTAAANAPPEATGPIVVLFIIGLAAAEAAIALSIILAVYRQRTSIDVDRLEDLQG